MSAVLPEDATVIPLAIPITISAEGSNYTAIALAQRGSLLFYLGVTPGALPAWFADTQIAQAAAK